MPLRANIDENIEKIRQRNLSKAFLGLIIVLGAGTIFYYLNDNGKHSLIDCFYMTFITITTIGFEEIIPLDKTGRIFTIIIALSGMGLISYMILNLAAIFVEGEINETIKKKKMEREIRKLKDHYIVCGIGKVGFYVARELHKTKRPYVVVDINGKVISEYLEHFPDALYIEGDATEEDTLERAGIKKAKGVFATTSDDSRNLMIVITAKLLNPSARIVALSTQIENIEKMKKIGAERVISPHFIGGMRMVSEMIRPTVVSFLDTMLRDEFGELRIEEIHVPKDYSRKTLSDFCRDFGLDRKRILILSLKRGDKFIYNPQRNVKLEGGEILVVMTTPEAREEVEDEIHRFSSK